MLLVNPPQYGTIWGTWIHWCLPWTHTSISNITACIPLPPWVKILMHTPLLLLSWVLWISWGHSHISIVPCCCDWLTCWLILTERLCNWGWSTDDYGCSLLICLIIWILVPFLLLGKARRAVPPFCFSHSSMRTVVAGRLVSLLLPTLLVVCIWSIDRKNFLTGPPFIPWLWNIYPCSMGEP